MTRRQFPKVSGDEDEALRTGFPANVYTLNTRLSSKHCSGSSGVERQIATCKSICRSCVQIAPGTKIGFPFCSLILKQCGAYEQENPNSTWHSLVRISFCRIDISIRPLWVIRYKHCAFSALVLQGERVFLACFFNSRIQSLFFDSLLYKWLAMPNK